MNLVSKAIFYLPLNSKFFINKQSFTQLVLEVIFKECSISEMFPT